MTKLTPKKVKFVWGDKQEAAAAFSTLKQKLCIAQSLHYHERSEDSSSYCTLQKTVLGASVDVKRKGKNENTVKKRLRTKFEPRRMEPCASKAGAGLPCMEIGGPLIMHESTIKVTLYNHGFRQMYQDRRAILEAQTMKST
ncbi:hypothetical protein Tco_0934269 [Tanacetum coccineum]